MNLSNKNNIIEKSFKLKEISGSNERKILKFIIQHAEIMPGQFFMLNFNGCQKPFSVYSYKKTDLSTGEVSFMIENRGSCSNKMLDACPGDYFGLTGPLGCGFNLNSYSRFLLLGGGIGVAPVLFAAEYLSYNSINSSGITVIIGENTAPKIIYKDAIDKLHAGGRTSCSLYTVDGSCGSKGFPTDNLQKILSDKSFDTVLICGPEKMITACLKYTDTLIKDKDIQICMERYMKCGLGLCGSCVIDNIGLRVCAEGPVFNYNLLRNSKEFGFYKRDSSGTKINV